jgi:hypothetical protein
MALAKLREDDLPATAAPAPQPDAQQAEEFAPVPSPASALRRYLARSTATSGAPDVKKWSPRSSLALIISASVALWLAILMAGSEVTKLIA